MTIKAYSKVLLVVTVLAWTAGFVGSPVWGASEPGTGTRWNADSIPTVDGVAGETAARANSFSVNRQPLRLAARSAEEEPTSGQPEETAGVADEITQLTARAGEGGVSVVVVESSGSIQYTAFKLLNPLRLVLDFPKMTPGSLAERLEVNQGVIDSIRTLHFDEANVLRLEIVLNQAAQYDIKKPKKNRLIVRLKAPSETQLAEAAEREMEQPSEEEPGEPVPADEKEKVGTSKKKLAEVRGDPCGPLLTGKKEPISLDFQDANIRNLFRIFSEISGFNLIISPEVSGTVNMRLMDVPWNEAFEIILANSGLDRQCLGDNIIRIASKATLAEEEQARVAANRRRQREAETAKLAEDLVTEVVRVNYADIQELAKNLDNLRTERGRITVDVRTNTLILTDVPEHVGDMVNLVQVLDIRTPQVMIESRIVEVNKDFSEELGVQWGVSGNLDTDGAITEGVDLQGATNASNTDFLVDLAGGGTLPSALSTSGLALTLGGLAQGVDLDVQLTALEEQGEGRILSSPRVTTLNNKEARIQSGRSIPFQTTSANEGTKTEFFEAELSLTVTPHITSDDYVYMIIEATKNAPDRTNTIEGFPEITTKEAFTEVLVANGDTTVLGGIYESDISLDKRAVPFFSKIPVLGHLFRSYRDSDKVNELLIFITPTIVSNNP